MFMEVYSSFSVGGFEPITRGYSLGWTGSVESEKMFYGVLRSWEIKHALLATSNIWKRQNIRYVTLVQCYDWQVPALMWIGKRHNAIVLHS